MFTFINTAVIFAFGLVITGIVALGVVQAREQARREIRVRATPSPSERPIPQID